MHRLRQSVLPISWRLRYFFTLVKRFTPTLLCGEAINQLIEDMGKVMKYLALCFIVVSRVLIIMVICVRCTIRLI
jgi:hypothetical protein